MAPYATKVPESFHVKRSNLVEVRARTDPDLPSLVIFKILDHEANWRRCLHGSMTASHGMTHLILFRPSGGLVLRKQFKPRGHSSHTRPPCGTRLCASLGVQSSIFMVVQLFSSVLHVMYRLDGICLTPLPNHVNRNKLW